MGQKRLYPIGTGESCRFAAHFLNQSGFQLTDHPSPEITHLLLDVPSFTPERLLRDGSDLRQLLRMLPSSITVIGGGLDAEFLKGYRKMDLLKDSHFLARNAAITAECALRAAMPHLKTTLVDTPTLILGWGRIGKCLAKLLSAMGCPVTVAARKERDRAMLEGLGYRAVDFSLLHKELTRHSLLFNTVPEGITLPEHSGSCVRIDLASLPGLQGEGILPARGLPGKYAPESAGKLISQTVSRLEQEVTA